METKRIARLLQSSVWEGTEQHLKIYCPSKTSKAAAYRRYGRANVDRWVSEGLLITVGKSLSKDQLDQVAASSNRITYMNSDLRNGKI